LYCLYIDCIRIVINDKLGRTWKEEVLAMFRCHHRIFLEGLRKTIRNLVQDSLSLGQHSNLGLPRYQIELLNALPHNIQRLVDFTTVKMVGRPIFIPV
jgi:hypothetical protein